MRRFTAAVYTATDRFQHFVRAVDGLAAVDRMLRAYPSAELRRPDGMDAIAGADFHFLLPGYPGAAKVRTHGE